MNIASLSTTVALWPTDWVIVGAFAIVVAFDAIRAGSRRAAALAIAAPMALMAQSQLASTAFIGPIVQQINAPYSGAIIFGALVIVFFLFAIRMLGLWGDDSCGPIQALLAGIACAAIVLLVWLQVPTLDSLWHFGPQVQQFFGQSYRLLWLLGSFLALAYVRG